VSISTVEEIRNYNNWI